MACHYHDLESQNHSPGTRRDFDDSVVECRKGHNVAVLLWCFGLCLASFLSLLALSSGALTLGCRKWAHCSIKKQQNGAFAVFLWNLGTQPSFWLSAWHTAGTQGLFVELSWDEVYRAALNYYWDSLGKVISILQVHSFLLQNNRWEPDHFWCSFPLRDYIYFGIAFLKISEIGTQMWLWRSISSTHSLFKAEPDYSKK